MLTVRKLLLNIYYWPVWLAVTILGICLLPAILVAGTLFFGRSIDSTMRRAIRFYGWCLVCVVPFAAPVRIEFKQPDSPLPAIIVANHNSAIDPFLFGAIPIENSFVTSWPFNIPVYRSFMRLAGYVNSEDGWDSVKQQATGLLDAGSSVTIWPEGHRSRNGQLGRFKNGAFQLAVESGYPVIPVAILGSATIMAPGKHALTPGRVKLIILDAIYPNSSLNRPDQIIDLRDRAKKALAATNLYSLSPLRKQSAASDCSSSILS